MCTTILLFDATSTDDTGTYIPQCSCEQVEPIVLLTLLVDICAVLTGSHCTLEVVCDQETWEQGQKENSDETVGQSRHKLSEEPKILH